MIAPSATAFLWKIPLCGLVYAVTTLLSAAAFSGLAPELPPALAEVGPALLLLRQLLAGMLLALGLAVIAPGLRGRSLVRWAVLSGFVYVVHSVTSAIEAHFFTTLEGMLSYMLPVAVAPSALAALAVVKLFDAPPSEGRLVRDLESYVSGRPAYAWAWRLPAAVVAFPIIYFAFGMMVRPFVLEVYLQRADLRIPRVDLLLAIQLGRSLLLLSVTLPILIMWWGSRLRLWLSLGSAFFLFMGVIGLLQGDLFSMKLRLVHGVEILADSFVYAGALVLLLGGKGTRDKGRGTREEG